MFRAFKFGVEKNQMCNADVIDLFMESKSMDGRGQIVIEEIIF